MDGAEGPPAGEQPVEGRQAKRREIGRKAQAKYRARQVEEIQQATQAVDNRQREREHAKARLMELLAENRALNLRNKQASAALLEIVRDLQSPSGSHHTGTTADTSTEDNRPAQSCPPPAAPPGRVDAPLYFEVIRLHDQNHPVAALEDPRGGSMSSHASAPTASFSTGDSEESFSTPDSNMTLPEAAAARQITQQLRAARAAAAAHAGVPPEAVRWVLQSPHAAPGGQPLSFSSEIATPECLASIYASFFVSLLEEPMLAAVLDVVDSGSVKAGDGRGRNGLQGVFDADSLASGKTPPHVALLSALDTALHGVDDLDSGESMLRCGISGRVPMGPAVKQAVEAVCRSGRRYLPCALWLRACDLFVQFMAGVTQYKPLGAGACPHRVVLPDGTEVHAVNACPRCSVFGHVFRTLREEIRGAVAGEPWEVEAVPLAEVRARCSDIYSFCDMLVSQCSTDQPVAFRQMMCTVRAVKSGGLKAEAEIVLDLFRQLRMSPEQQGEAAEVWRVWKATRAALDRQLTAALEPLSTLLDLPDLVLDDSAESLMPSTHAVRSLRACGWLDGAALEGGDQGFVSSVESAADAGTLELCGGSCGEAAEISGDALCLCAECAENMAERLLGGNGRSTAAARRALQAVKEVHRRDAETGVEQLRAICMPGVIFTPEQYARQTALVLQQGALMDWVWLCKTAADESKREALFGDLKKCCSVV